MNVLDVLGLLVIIYLYSWTFTHFIFVEGYYLLPIMSFTYIINCDIIYNVFI